MDLLPLLPLLDQRAQVGLIMCHTAFVNFDEISRISPFVFISVLFSVKKEL